MLTFLLFVIHFVYMYIFLVIFTSLLLRIISILMYIIINIIYCLSVLVSALTLSCRVCALYIFCIIILNSLSGDSSLIGPESDVSNWCMGPCIECISL